MSWPSHVGGWRFWRTWEFELNLSRHEDHDSSLENHERRLAALEERLSSLEHLLTPRR